MAETETYQKTRRSNIVRFILVLTILLRACECRAIRNHLAVVQLAFDASAFGAHFCSVS